MLHFKYSFLNTGRYKLLQNDAIRTRIATCARVIAYICLWVILGFSLYTMFKLMQHQRAQLPQERVRSVVSKFNRLQSINDSQLSVEKPKADQQVEIQLPLMQQTESKSNKKVTIYAATKFFAWYMDDERFLIGCQDFQSWCHISNNTNDYSKADAVVFHNADYGPKIIPPTRDPKVPWVLFSLESPANDRFRPSANIINWTMTYRLDSDVWHPYGAFDKLEKRIDVDFDKIWNEKTAKKTVTWLASNCNARNKRREIIKSIINNGVEADLFGKCGNPAPKCDGVNLQGDECVIELIKPYKFYFSFENSNCQDYVTEKFYETLGSRMAVPIVMKRSLYEKVGAPSNSFIAVDDFKSIAELADHINKVKDDKEKYLEYHQWRKEYRVLPEKNPKTGFCGLCTKLRDGSNWEPKTYGNLKDWHSKDKCDNMYLSNLL